MYGMGKGVTPPDLCVRHGKRTWKGERRKKKREEGKEGRRTSGAATHMPHRCLDVPNNYGGILCGSQPLESPLSSLAASVIAFFVISLPFPLLLLYVPLIPRSLLLFSPLFLVHALPSPSLLLLSPFSSSSLCPFLCSCLTFLSFLTLFLFSLLCS